VSRYVSLDERSLDVEINSLENLAKDVLFLSTFVNLCQPKNRLQARCTKGFDNLSTYYIKNLQYIERKAKASLLLMTITYSANIGAYAKFRGWATQKS
jgi:hypothetical protein